MRVLGIDPGTGRIGFGVLEKAAPDGFVDCGLIAVKSENRAERLHLIYLEIKTLLEKFKPDCMALERLFFSKNIKTAMSVSEAIGVILMASHQAGVPVEEYTSQQVKEVVVGSGKASKQEVKGMMEILLDRKIKGPDDVADALAIAFCHLALEPLACFSR